MAHPSRPLAEGERSRFPPLLMLLLPCVLQLQIGLLGALQRTEQYRPQLGGQAGKGSADTGIGSHCA